MKEKEEHGNMRVGVAIIRQLSTAFYSDAANVFEELVSNSYDAGATHVAINIGDDKITIEDNGLGMTSEELMRFFYISHTEKLDAKKYVHLSRLKRAIIGKFGIGKLSMYRICKKFHITTWKDAMKTTAEFSFDELEKLDFVDELALSVKSSVAGDGEKEKTGTHITLLELRKPINNSLIRRYLSKTMPLKPDFKLVVNGIECTPTKLEGQFYNIEDEVEECGPVSGTLVYTNTPLQERDAGIYIRVAGRVVNHNPRIIELGNLRSALTLARRTYMEISADWLTDAIKSDRTGFLEDDPKYETLLRWIGKTLNKYNKVEMDRRTEEKYLDENNTVTKTLRYRLSGEPTTNAYPHSGGAQLVAQGEKAGDDAPSEIVKVTFNGHKFRIVNITGNTGGPVWEVSRDLILMNSSHPLAVEARERKCLDFHVLNVAIQAVAREVSKNIEEEKENYEVLARQVCKNKD